MGKQKEQTEGSNMARPPFSNGVAADEASHVHFLMDKSNPSGLTPSASASAFAPIQSPDDPPKFAQRPHNTSDDNEVFYASLEAKFSTLDHYQNNEITARLLETSQSIAKVGSVELDIETQAFYWSAETYRIHETTPDEYTPSVADALDSYFSESRARIKHALHQAIVHGVEFDIELQKRTFKGRIIDLRATSLINKKEGKPTKLTIIYQDITERRYSERRQQHHNIILNKLLQSKPLLEILNTIAEGVVEINSDMQCSIFLLDSTHHSLNVGGAAGLSENYLEALEGVKIGKGVGACGEAAFTGKRVITENVNTHRNWQKFLGITQPADIHSCWSEPILSASGNILGTLAIYHKQPRAPSEEHIAFLQSEAQLAALAIEKVNSDAQLELAASVFTNAKEGIVITDLFGNIVEVNQTFSDISGFSRGEVLGKNTRVFRSNKHDPIFYAMLWKHLLADGYWTGEIWNVRKDGEPYAAMMTISAVVNTANRVKNYVCLFTDITPIKEQQRQLEHIAHFDSLTQLPNRVLLADRLNQAIAGSHRTGLSLAVLYLDLDGFKEANDTYGHSMGDHLLVSMGHRLKSTLREGDTLARIGGDEFIAVLTGLETDNECESMVKRLLDTASEPVAINGVIIRLSVSIGVTLYPKDNSDPEQLIRHADQAMYLAKQAGKNGSQLFDVALNSEVKNRYESLDRIRAALQNKEFVLHYQPKVNMRSGTVVGVEALVRWQHPERGLLLPEHFLPVTEMNSVGLELGEWVLRRAVAQLEIWGKLGLDTNVSVNISAQQILQSQFVTTLTQLLAEFPSVEPSRLSLEVLETSALEDLAEVAQIMESCKDLGVEFAVDDFGTGYSSLTYLKRLPASLLKIDQSFIRDMLEDADDMAIVVGVIGLAGAFQREVIAEGLETSEQGEMLLKLGCDLAQGYGIAKPMPAENVPQWTESWVQDALWQRQPMQQALQI